MPETAQATADAAAAKPNADLKPLVKTNARATGAPEGAATASTPAVEVSLRWCVVQPSASAEPSDWQWAPYDQAYTKFRQQGVEIRTLRIVDAPKWAITSSCWDLAQSGTGVKMCPPRADRDPDLRKFARHVAARYGPGTTYGVSRLSLWNEPNIPKNWGSPEKRWNDLSDEDKLRFPRRYSDRLVPFSNGASAGNSAIKADVGEVASDSRSPENGGTNAARPWAKTFAEYNSDNGRSGLYNQLAIHAYSEFPSQVPRKVANYLILRGVNSVAVTEVGWAVDDVAASNQRHWKCMGSEGGQKSRFESLIATVRDSDTKIHRLAWFNLIDNRKGANGLKCRQSAWYSGNEAWREMNSYGLFRRRADGELDSFAEATARPLCSAFRQAQQPSAPDCP